MSHSESNFKPSTLVHLLRWRALHQSDQRAYTFLADGETEEDHLTYSELDRQAQAIGAMLQSLEATGERALLLYPPSLDYIAGFFGCLYAGVITVPAYPPDPARLDRTLPRLQAIVADAQATVALTTAPILAMAQFLFDQAPALKAMKWLPTDTIAGSVEHKWQEPAITGDSLAFLQYTSGSTRAPRGVMLSHSNLLYNSTLISQAMGLTSDSVVVSWLPPYHDMGLIGAILQPLYGGFPCILMSPVSFLQRPFRWLQAISRYQATGSGGPNFAYDLCVRKITPEQRATLDLSSWSVAFNGSEPVRRETLDRFTEAFEPCGFRREAFYPCYGLAEATLMVSGGPPPQTYASGSWKAADTILYTVQKGAIERDQVVEASGKNEDAQTLVGCGQCLMGQEIVIVHPESLTQNPPDQVGEIWVSGPSVAQGYWGRPDETEQTFRAYLADTGAGPFLRTGDLGFMRGGELFITGRLKDLIIIRGRNHYPQDIEFTVERSHPALRPGCGAAFSVDVGGEERLVVVHEVYTNRQWDADEVVGAIRQAVAEAHEVQVYAVALIRPRSIPKTSSGKIQRRACRALFLADALDVVEASTLDDTPLLRREESAVRVRECSPRRRDEEGPTQESLLVKALRTMDPEACRSLLESHVQELVAQVLRLAPSQLDPQQPLNTLGLDSVLIVDLASEIESSLGVPLGTEDLFQDVTISQLASLVLTELTAPSPRPEAGPPPVQEPVAEYPLSHGQRALWFLQQLSPESAAYNLVHAARVRTDLDVSALQRAFQKLVDRHSSLRTTFSTSRGEPVQRVHEHVEVCFQKEDASTWSEAALNDRLAEEVYRPFDLERGPLVRMTLFTRSAQEHIIVLAMHHIVTDLWSVVILLYELGVLYTAEKAGVPASLKPLPARYSDYVRWQAEMLSGPEGDRLWAYWREQLAGELPVLNLPTDRPRPPVQTDRGAAETIRLGTELTQSLRSLARAHGTTLYSTLLAAFQVLLHRYTGQEDILVGSPKAGRSRKLARLVGYFVNPVVLRADLSGNPTFSAFLDRTHHTTLAAFEHGDYPFPLLVERLQPERDPSRSPIFQVMFAWQKTTRLLDSQNMTSFALSEAGRKLELGELSLESIALEHRVAPFDLTLYMAEAGGELVASAEYNTDLFDAGTIRRMLGHFQTLLAGVAADPDQPICTLPLLTEAERQQLLVTWNDTAADYPQDQCAHHLFEAQVERTPEAIAVVFGEERLTYRALNRRANQLAHHLQKLGMGPETLVGIATERSPEMVVGLLGILKAGGAYLPLDPTYPPERLAFMLEDAEVRVLLTQSHLLDRLPAPRTTQHASRITHHASRRVICLDSDWDLIAQESEENPASSATPDNLAYVIYTSGSTGTPKGIAMSHRPLYNLLSWQLKNWSLPGAARTLQFAPISFDVSFQETFSTWCSGGTLVLISEEMRRDAVRLSRFLADEGVERLFLPLVALQHLAETTDGQAASPTALGEVITAGEQLQITGPVVRLFGKLKRCTLHNQYGPTESHVVTAFTLAGSPGDWPALPPIGRPIDNTQIYLLDKHLQPVPVGIPGELYIGGDSLARGYLNRPELTAERFIPNPFAAPAPSPARRGTEGKADIPPSLSGRGRGRVASRPERDSVPEAGSFSGVPAPTPPSIPPLSGGGVGGVDAPLSGGGVGGVDVPLSGRRTGGVSSRLYKTGDLARYLPNGDIEFLGRTDHQVKIRGFRVEPGEIEVVLAGHPALREAVVLVQDAERVPGRGGASSGGRRLVAYVVPKEDEGRKTEDESAPSIAPRPSSLVGDLRAFLKEKLPGYMIPSAFVVLEALPLTPSGKVNRRALPAPSGARPELETAFVAPRTPVEEELAAIWAQLLGVEQVGVHDNFFELGGHSLLATQLISRLRETFQVELPLRSLFEATTVADLAVVIAQRQVEQEDDAQVTQLLAELEQLSEDEVQEMLADETLLQ